MASTFQATDQELVRNELTNTLLSKLNIDTDFLEEVVEKAVTNVNKSVSGELLKQFKSQKPALTNKPSQQKAESENNQKATKPNKEKNDNTASSSVNTQPKKETLNVTNNTFEITNTPKTNTAPDVTALFENLNKQQNNKSIAEETFFDRVTKSLEKVTNNLKDTIKEIPRPWELTPGTSMGYQMLAGEDEAMTERIRKGLAQFIGRYATNIKEPVGYSLPETFDFKAILKDKPQWLDEKILSKDTNARETLYREMFDLPSRQTKELGLTKIGPKEYTLDKGPLAPTIEDNITFYDPAARESDEKRNERIRKRLPEPEFSPEQGVSKYKEQIAANPKWAETLSYQARDPNVLGNYTPRFDPTTKSFNYKDVWDIISPPDKTKDYDGTGVSERLRQLIAPILRPATVSGTIETGLTKEISTKIEKIPALNSLSSGLQNFENNNWIDGLKDISSFSPSIKSVISFLTSRDTPSTLKDTIDTTKALPSFSKLKDWIEETTFSKISTWTTDLYDWSKEKINSVTDSLNETIEDSKKMISMPEMLLPKTTNPVDIKINESRSLIPKTVSNKATEFAVEKSTPQINPNTFSNEQKNNTENKPLNAFNFDSIELKKIVQSIVPETPELQKTVSPDNLQINNNTLDKIASNTQNTNAEIKTLGETILRLAQALNNKNGKTNSVVVPLQTPQTQTENFPSASQVANNNVDPIGIIRKQFLFK